MNAHPLTAPVDPAPHRDRASRAVLYLCLLAGPLAWKIQLIADSALASYACRDDRAGGLRPGWDWAWDALLAVDLVALAISLGAAAVAYAALRRTEDEHTGGKPELIEAGEGRSRFLASWGVLSGIAFALALAFNVFGLLLVPLCGG